MRFNPSFIQLKGLIDLANDFGSSPDNANPHRSWLKLAPNEIYNQYILLDEDLADTLQQANIQRVNLCNANGEVLTNNVGFGYKKIISDNAIYFSFTILNDYGDECLCLRLDWSKTSDSRQEALYSNLFTCNELNRERTSMVTYKHTGEFYGIPYGKIPDFQAEDSFSMNYSNQIRLPIYHLRKKTEQDSTENTYSVNTPTNINVSRVQRRNLKVWQVIANDWVNERIAIVTDTDYVYINGQREITRPYEFEPVSNGGDFSISQTETQPKEGDTYLDEDGLVNHKPVITNIVFPNGSCCVPSGDPITEPEIVNVETAPDTCYFEGIHKVITVTGEPSSTIKYRITLNSMSGTAKSIKVWNSDVVNSYLFDDVSDVYVGYFYTNSGGNAEINLSCCLEDCTPGVNVEVNSDLEMYNMDGVTLSGQSVNIQKSKTCPLPQAPNWVVVSESGSNTKELKIEGDANTVAVVNVRVAGVISAGGLPNNSVDMGTFLNVTNVIMSQEWDINVPIGSLGESVVFEVECDAGRAMPLPQSMIAVLFRLRDLNGDISSEVVGIIDYNNI